jgi:hypothetical protein
MEAANLANELKGGVMELGIGRSMVAVAEAFDVSTHF